MRIIAKAVIFRESGFLARVFRIVNNLSYRMAAERRMI